jgi:hypothetical protein
MTSQNLSVSAATEAKTARGISIAISTVKGCQKYMKKLLYECSALNDNVGAKLYFIALLHIICIKTEPTITISP